MAEISNEELEAQISSLWSLCKKFGKAAGAGAAVSAASIAGAYGLSVNPEMMGPKMMSAAWSGANILCSGGVVATAGSLACLMGVGLFRQHKKEILAERMSGPA